MEIYLIRCFFWFRSHFSTTKLQPNGSSFIANPVIAQMMQFGLKPNRKINSVDFPRKSPKPKTQTSHNNRKHINKYHENAKYIESKKKNLDCSFMRRLNFIE